MNYPGVHVEGDNVVIRSMCGEVFLAKEEVPQIINALVKLAITQKIVWSNIYENAKS
jgi:hypothetical protein